MGISLRRSAFSPNIEERRDYSCAVFNQEGLLIAQGDYMPVHLGSMPMSVRAALETVQLAPGDIDVLNDPYAGGTHLPGIGFTDLKGAPPECFLIVDERLEIILRSQEWLLCCLRM